MRKFTLAVSLVLLVMTAGMAEPVSAHSPLFPPETHSLDTAMPVNDPAKSWVIYGQLDTDQADYYRMEMSIGDRIFLQSLTPYAPGFLPTLALLLPGPGPDGGLPSYVEIPDGYHAIVASGDPNVEGGLEPFTPGPIFILATIDIEAITNGTYYAVVFSGEQSGNYAIAIGYLEEFSAGEILALPVNLFTIYQWEGQPLSQALLPYVLVFGLGLILAYYGYRRTAKPGSWVKWLALVASLAFIGSTASVISQLAFSFTRVPVSSEIWLSLGFASAYLIMGLLLALFAYRDYEEVLRWRLVFLLIGVIGLTMWGGLYIGPILSLVVAFAPPYKRRINRTGF